MVEKGKTKFKAQESQEIVKWDEVAETDFTHSCSTGYERTDRVEDGRPGFSTPRKTKTSKHKAKRQILSTVWGEKDAH